MIALPGTHDPFMRHGTHRCHIPFFRQIDIGSTDAGRILIVLIVHRQFLCLRGQAAPQSKFAKITKTIGSIYKFLNLILQPLPEGSIQSVIIIIHPEKYFVDDGKSRDLIHGSV